MSTRQDADYWKERYRESLREHEVTEAAWRQAEKTLRHAIARLSLAIDASDSELAGQLEALRQATRRDAPSEQIKDLIAQISATLVRLDGQSAADVGPSLGSGNRVDHDAMRPNGVPVVSAPTALPSYDEVLLDLVQRLDFPASCAEQLAETTALLRGERAPTAAAEAVRRIAALVIRARQAAELERREIEAFLSQLTGHLEALDRYLDDSTGRLNQASEQDHLIDESVSTSVAEIRRSMHAAQDIGQLKQAIQAHLSNIQVRMEARKRLGQEQLWEAEARAQELKQELSRVQDESRQLRERLHEAADLAMRDGLTGLNNRLAFDERIALECERWARYGRPAVLSIWDIDFFKGVNDRFGHSAGDKVLRIIAGLMKKSVRKVDFVARSGGEEFVLLLPETEIRGALEAADKLRAAIASSRFQYRGEPVPVTISCGLAELIPGDTPEAVYRRADQALYEAKRAGRNCCRVYGWPPPG